MRDDITNPAEITLSLNPSDTGNLGETLLIKVGYRVMLTINMNVTDDLTNGGSGTVTDIVTRSF